MNTMNAGEVVKRWMQAVNTRQLEDVLSLYAADAVLLPTFSPNTLRSEQDRRRYFEQLAARPGLSVSLHEKTVRVQQAGGSIEIATGIYRFHVEIESEPLVFEARFTFVVDAASTKPILHHHSSQIPRTLS